MTSRYKTNARSEPSNSLTIILASCGLILAVLLVNANLFHVPIVEDGDFAANAIQVQNAKVFRELLGNYSRFHFHHPGPAFFYIFAAGEYVFYDLFHIVPAALNAEILTIILLNVLFLFGSIAIFQKYASSPLVTPCAIGISLLLIQTINVTTTSGAPQNGALVSVWMPHVLLFCFLFFGTTCASVAAGEHRHLPLAVLAGGLLVHGHVAQILFVGALFGSSCLVFFFRSLTKFKSNPSNPVDAAPSVATIAFCIAIILVFLLPIGLDVYTHRPSNFSDIYTYMEMHRGFENSVLVSLGYYLSFWEYMGAPETFLFKGSHSILGFPRPLPTPVIICWFAMAVLFACALATHARHRPPANPFLRFVLYEIVLTSVLFFVWSAKISGPLYNFNGFFINSIQFLLLFAAMSVVVDGIPLRIPSAAATILSCFALTPVILSAPAFRTAYWGNPEVEQITSRVPLGETGVLHLTFPPSDWPLAAGVASSMKRHHAAFCVDPEWGFMFEETNVCGDPTKLETVSISNGGANCVLPCESLFHDQTVTVQLRTFPMLDFPIQILAADPRSAQSGFYGLEGDSQWSQKASTIRFLLAGSGIHSSTLTIVVTGTTLPNRPVKVFFNGLALGEVDGEGFHSSWFTVNVNNIHIRDENSIAFEVENAGPVGADPRTLGYFFHRVEINTMIPTPQH